MKTEKSAAKDRKARGVQRRVIGSRLRKLLDVVFGLFALLAVNSTYLVGVSVLEWARGETYQNWFYMVMFLGHLALGLLIIVPVLVFGGLHMRNSYNRPNRRAVYVGYALFAIAVTLLASGLVLMIYRAAMHLRGRHD